MSRGHSAGAPTTFLQVATSSIAFDASSVERAAGKLELDAGPMPLGDLLILPQTQSPPLQPVEHLI
jgi:hypothetical protein